MDIFGGNLDIWVLISMGFLGFMAVRGFLTWYWKISEIVELLEKIEKNTSPKKENKELSQSADIQTGL